MELIMKQETVNHSNMSKLELFLNALIIGMILFSLPFLPELLNAIINY